MEFCFQTSMGGLNTLNHSLTAVYMLLNHSIYLSIYISIIYHVFISTNHYFQVIFELLRSTVKGNSLDRREIVPEGNVDIRNQERVEEKL